LKDTTIYPKHNIRHLPTSNKTIRKNKRIIRQSNIHNT